MDEMKKWLRNQFQISIHLPNMEERDGEGKKIIVAAFSSD